MNFKTQDPRTLKNIIDDAGVFEVVKTRENVTRENMNYLKTSENE